ncbi:MAG: hypothetical protein Q8934_08990 [Bacillota bacterium]|nr:hypothetical protein [Bacillota bacterium]
MNQFPIKYLEEDENLNDDYAPGAVYQTVDKRYKMTARVSPINGELIGDDELTDVYDAIRTGLGSYSSGRFGIYIQSEKINIESNIRYIEDYKMRINEEHKIEALEDQRSFLETMTDKSRNVFNFYITIESSQSKYEIARQMLEDDMNSIKEEFAIEDMEVRPLGGTELKRFLYEQMNPQTSNVEEFHKDWSLSEIQPQNLEFSTKEGDTLFNDGMYYRYITIDRFPKTVDEYRWLRKLFTVKGDIDVAITLNPKNKSKIQEELSRASSELNVKAREAKQKKDQLRYQKQQETADKLIEEIGDENNTLYDVNFTIGIRAEDKEKLKTLVTLVRNRLSGIGCKSFPIRNKELEPFWLTLPILYDSEINRNVVWNLTTSDVASLIPFDSSELMERKGILQGDNVTSNGLVIVDPFDKKKYDNTHMAVIAYSGSGKTFYLSCDAIRHMPYRDYIVMFKVEEEEGDLNFPFATTVQFSPTKNFVTNPFHIRNAIMDSEGNDDGSNDIGGFLARKIMDTITFFKWIYPEMTSYDESLLEMAIRKAYAKEGLTFESTELPEKFPTLSTLEEVITEMIEKGMSDKEKEHLVNMKAVFNPYTHGAYSKMFNEQTNWEFEPFTVLDISKVSDAVRKPLYDIILKDLWQFCKTDRTKEKRIYIDEAHEFADPKRPQTLEFISTLIKRGRKYGVSIVTATQNLPDFLSIERHGQAIIDNSHFKLFLSIGENDHKLVETLYNFSEHEMKILKRKKKSRQRKGRGIFIAGSQRVELQVKASPWELEMVDPSQFEEIYKKKSRYRKTS